MMITIFTYVGDSGDDKNDDDGWVMPTLSGEEGWEVVCGGLAGPPEWQWFWFWKNLIGRSENTDNTENAKNAENTENTRQCVNTKYGDLAGNGGDGGSSGWDNDNDNDSDDDGDDENDDGDVNLFQR